MVSSSGLRPKRPIDNAPDFYAGLNFTPGSTLRLSEISGRPIIEEVSHLTAPARMLHPGSALRAAPQDEAISYPGTT